ncbi:MAG: sterol desaturase family protein [Verrucomicrobia bacterium]|nr:sterol desaturase family protein [Verrucomicrobiota bacterium]
MNKPLTLDRLALVFGADYITHLIRYALIAGGAFLIFYVWRNRRLRALKIQENYPARSEMRREVLYSLLSLAIFSCVGVLVFVMHRLGWAKLYLDINERGWGWFAFSTALLIFAHDAYFYWTHRLMHWKPLFPIVHRIHHLSHTPTPWAAFAFHPIEAVVEAGIFPIFILFVPTHPLSALIWLLYMTVMNVLGHCGFEILQRGFTRHPLTRWHNTAVHHDMHHRHVHCNYGLYYNLWDRLMDTNHARYDEEFERVKAKGKPAGGNSEAAPGQIRTRIGV